MKKKAPARSVAKLTTLDSFLQETGKRDGFEAVAIKEARSWQVIEAAKQRRLPSTDRLSE